MTDEEQIKELAWVIRKFIEASLDKGYGWTSTDMAAALFKAGYRKAEETQRAIADEI